MVQTVVPPSRSPEVASMSSARRRSPRARVSRAAALAWLAGTLAFVLSASVLRDRAEQVEVLVAASDIPAGAEITDTMLRRVRLDADSPLLASLVRSGGLTSGQLAADTIIEGAPIRTADLVEAGRGDGLRAMSIEVDRAHAVGGALAVGDRVDVIDALDGRATFVVVDAEVIDLPAQSTGRGITGGSSGSAFFVVVRVDAAQALALAGATEEGRLQVIRSTGAAPVEQGTATSQADTEAAEE